MRTRRQLALVLVAVLALGAGVVGLALVATGFGAPPLLTQASRVGGPPAGGACYLSFIEGPLVSDATYGTAIVANGSREPVMWPCGYRARVSGGHDSFGSPGYFRACGARGSLPLTLPGS